MLNCTNLAEFVLFADDTNTFVIAESIKEVYEMGNKVLDAIYWYMYANKLHINHDKVFYMHFKPKGNKAVFELESNNYELYLPSKPNKPLEQVKETKFLGVIIDNKLSWLPHISYLENKLKVALGIVKRIRQHIPYNNNKSIYNSLFESHLIYCISVLGGIPKTHTQKLIRLHKKCLRILFGDKEKYEEKFETAARCRPYPNQLLGNNFYVKEHTKPIFNKFEILYFDLFIIV